ncbi:hypothetical protein K1719_010667 [Acacia pycnantha]|nr:hypothetical protein K1719_010667 [Acacia pycnantha]
MSREFSAKRVDKVPLPQEAWIFTSHRHRTFCICYVTILSKVHSLTNIRGYNSHVAGNAIVNLLAKLSTMKRFYELNLSRLKLGKPLGFAGILHIIEALAENNYLEELNLSGNAVPNELHTLQVDFSAEVCPQLETCKEDLPMMVDDSEEPLSSYNLNLEDSD